jgi:NADH-quinone oxidoreductase subunit M
MPGLSGFIAEFPIFSGLWQGPVFANQAIAGSNALRLLYFPTYDHYPLIAVISVISIIVTAAYVLRVTGAVFFGGFNEARFPGITDVTLIDKSALALLAVFLVVLGVYPQIMSGMVQAGMEPILKALGG